MIAHTSLGMTRHTTAADALARAGAETVMHGASDQIVGAVHSMATSAGGETLGALPAVSSTVGGSTVVALAAILTFFVAVGLSLVVTYQVVQGYRQTRARPFLFLAVGIFLLAPAPMLLRFVLANATSVPFAVRSLTAAGSELLGLLCILYTVYQR